MKSYFFRFSLFLTACLALLTRSPAFANTNPSQLETWQPLVSSYNQNAFRLYQAILSQNQNVFISPYGLFSLMTALKLSTAGNTQQEIQATLKFPNLSQPELIVALNQWNQLLTQAPPCQKGILCLTEKYFPWIKRIIPSLFSQPVSLTNTFWIDEHFPIRPDFQNQLSKLKDYYFLPVNFKNHPEQARETINAWIKKQTQKQIPLLLAKGSTTPSTQLILTQTVLFHNTWEKPFKPSQTRLEIFHESTPTSTAALTPASNIAPKRIAMMHNHGKIAYFENEQLKLMVLPYQGQQQLWVGILPNHNHSLKDIENQLNYSQLKSWLDSAKFESVNYALPKMHIHYRYTEWIPVFKQLGIHTLFSNQADFSPLTESRLQVFQIIHETDLKLDEAGTQASAASAAILIGATFSPPKKMEFNQPFIFLIIDQKTQTILFIGKILTPDTSSNMKA